MFMENKLNIPAAIVLSAVILGGFVYASQINKQNSIERQQLIELQANERQQLADLNAKQDAEQIKSDKDSADALFNNNLKCQTLLKDLNQRWNNVVGIYYSEWQNTCIVKYTLKGETQEAPIESMEDNP